MQRVNIQFLQFFIRMIYFFNLINSSRCDKIPNMLRRIVSISKNEKHHRQTQNTWKSAFQYNFREKQWIPGTTCETENTENYDGSTSWHSLCQVNRVYHTSSSRSSFSIRWRLYSKLLPRVSTIIPVEIVKMPSYLGSVFTIV